MVRQANVKDLTAVAKIHMECFPGTVTSRLGTLWNGIIVVNYYKEYFNDSPELFLVAENDSGDVIGFCMGYKLEREGDCDKKLIRHHCIPVFFGFLYLIIKGDKECWRKLKSFFKLRDSSEENTTIIDPSVYNRPRIEKAELFTIGLLEKYRGQSIGRALIIAYFEACRRVGRNICLISYINENTSAELFYYKNGCKPYIENGNNKICYKIL